MPQEIEVFYVIPAIRKHMAMAMKRAGKKQKEIAAILCVEESTISHYLNDKRATEFKIQGKVEEAVTESVKRIDDRLSLIAETQKLLDLIKKENALNNVCFGNKK